MTTRPCWVEINLGFLEENFRTLKSLAPPGAELMAVLKADAYGHSLALCAPAVVRAGAQWIAVTSAEEGAAARALAPETRMMVIGGVVPGQGATLVQHRLTPVVWEAAQLDDLEAAARAAGAGPASVPVHVEIDTGMSRQGADLDALPSVLERFSPSSPLKLEGVATHLFAADESSGQATQSQLDALQKALEIVEAAGIFPDWLNVGQSSVLLSGESGVIADLAARHGMKALMRPGIALYGVVPRFFPEFAADAPEALATAHARLRPVLTFKTKVIGVRAIPAGAVVGYNATFVATEPMRVALLPAGYADGLSRLLGNRFSLLVRGQRAPLIGRVSMDHAVIDITEIDGVEAGDEVVILGQQGENSITAYDHADATGTIPWDVFTRIAARVPRIAL